MFLLSNFIFLVDFLVGSNLIVRRGSEPSLTNIGTSPNNHDTMPDRPNKRWSAIAAIDEDKMSTPRVCME